MRLHKQRRFARIESQGQQIQSGISNVRPQKTRVPNGCQGMQISDEVIAVVLVLQFDVLLDGTEIIAPVETPGGLNAAQNSHGNLRKKTGTRIQERLSSCVDGLGGLIFRDPMQSRSRLKPNSPTAWGSCSMMRVLTIGS